MSAHQFVEVHPGDVGSGRMEQVLNLGAGGSGAMRVIDPGGHVFKKYFLGLHLPEC
tara:strand:+ start:147268 stop:147435 length:168 start_codon:yes stop_codon:yes gene_type:complete